MEAEKCAKIAKEAPPARQDAENIYVFTWQTWFFFLLLFKLLTFFCCCFGPKSSRANFCFGVNCQVSSCQHPESAGTHRLMLVPRRLGLHSAGGLWERFGCSHSLGRTGWGAHAIFFGISLLPPLLMEKKSCTTWDGAKTLYIMRNNYWPQQVTPGFINSMRRRWAFVFRFVNIGFQHHLHCFACCISLEHWVIRATKNFVTVIMRLSGVIGMKPIGSRYIFTWSCKYHKNLRYYFIDPVNIIMCEYGLNYLKSLF